MSTKLVLVPHNLGSQSAKELANSLSSKLGFKVFRVRPTRIKNRIPFFLKEGTDKLTQLTKFKDAGINCPEFTTSRDNALGWLNDGTVVCRTLLRGSEGRGIVLAETPELVVEAPLYTKYFKKKREFRVHVFNGNVIDVQEKRKKQDFSNERDTRIRNLANGYVFCRGDLQEPAGLRDLAIRATNVLGYTVGAVDIAYNEHLNQLVVFEVNANPGLKGTTLENYSLNIINWYKEYTNGLS
jgi:glutathione synthase/RimK-type ligase-like ATP-grasp enzyme